MLEPLPLLSASRQNLLRLTFIRILVLAAQAGSVGSPTRPSCCSCPGWSCRSPSVYRSSCA